jgi:hypothetical protein
MAIETKSPFVVEQAQGASPAFLLDSRFVAGNVYFVNAASANSGTSTGKGRTPSAPFSTIQAALNACTADQGDVVIVLPTHQEIVTGAAGISLAKDGVKVLGVGDGRNRPRIVFTTAAAASLDITAARCTLENLVLVSTIDAQTAMVNISTADCVIKGCEIQLGDASTQAALGILTTAGANRLRVEGNHIHGGTTAGTTAALRLVGGDGIVIQDNIITGAFGTTGVISNITTAATMLVIRNNVLMNDTADGNNILILVEATTTGIIADNRGAIIDSTGPAPITAAIMYRSGNWIATNVNAASTLF